MQLTPRGRTRSSIAAQDRWLRSALRGAAATALLLSAAAPAQVDPGLKATLLRQGFAEADFRHLNAAERPPHKLLMGSFFGCLTSKPAIYLANDWSVAKALDAATLLCSDKEAALRDSLAVSMGDAPARRVIALGHALVRTAFEQADARRKAAPTLPPAPFRPIPPDDDFGGGWTFSRGKDGSCNATLEYNRGGGPSVYVMRARDRYTIVLRQKFTLRPSSQPTETRQVFFFYGQRAVERTVTFVTDKDEDNPLLVLSLTPQEIEPWRDLTLLWVGPRQQGDQTETSFEWYPLHDLAATLTRLDWCMK